MPEADTQAFVSIGCNCSSVLFLRGQRLRTQALPGLDDLLFDWARSDLTAVRNVLEQGIDYHLASVLQPDYPVAYVHLHHMPTEAHEAYLIRCARRFFDTIEHAGDLYLIYCSPYPADAQALLLVEQAMLRYRGSAPFKILALHGFTGPEGQRGIVGEALVSPRITHYKIAADRLFDTNRMEGPFYDDLRRALLPTADETRVYHSTV